MKSNRIPINVCVGMIGEANFDQHAMDEKNTHVTLLNAKRGDMRSTLVSHSYL